jgi:hypothetical protein
MVSYVGVVLEQPINFYYETYSITPQKVTILMFLNFYKSKKRILILYQISKQMLCLEIFVCLTCRYFTPWIFAPTLLAQYQLRRQETDHSRF